MLRVMKLCWCVYIASCSVSVERSAEDVFAMKLEDAVASVSISVKVLEASLEDHLLPAMIAVSVSSGSGTVNGTSLDNAFVALNALYDEKDEVKKVAHLCGANAEVFQSLNKCSERYEALASLIHNRDATFVNRTRSMSFFIDTERLQAMSQALMLTASLKIDDQQQPSSSWYFSAISNFISRLNR
jgi:hypothetical protein